MFVVWILSCVVELNFHPMYRTQVESKSTSGEVTKRFLPALPGKCVCVCESRYVSCGMRVKIKYFFDFFLVISSGPVHYITTLATEASDVMGSGWRCLTMHLLKTRIFKLLHSGCFRFTGPIHT